MNKRVQPTVASEPDALLWSIRDSEGTTFGPATIDVLKKWARDGRLAPNHEASHDGRKWQAVTSLSELEMDIVVEVAPGTFYGPVHRQALAELIREGALHETAPLFSRATNKDEDARAAVAADQRAQTRRWEALRLEQTERIAALESQLKAAQDEHERVAGELANRDLEFEAERQELQAAATRQQADLAKLRTLHASLEKRLAEAAVQERDLQESRAVVVALEERLAQAAEAQEVALATLRQELAVAERERQQSIAAVAAERATLGELNERFKQLRLRQNSLRKLLQQATSLLGVEEQGEVVLNHSDSVTIVSDEPLPPRTSITLNELEAQAQREIGRLGRQPNGVFGRRR